MRVHRITTYSHSRRFSGSDTRQKQQRPLETQRGFSLLESAIVVTIIGLLAGGIVLAKGMIRSAQVLSVIDDIDSYKQAIKLFQDKYQYLPGDMPTAESFWGTDPGGCPYTPYTTTPQTATCNGNGDGRIGFSAIGLGWLNANEIGRAWQQLANAGLIKGTFSGTNGSSSPGPNSLFVAYPGINTPASQVPSGGYSLWYISNPTGNAADWAGIGHIIMFGGADANRYTDLPILSTAEASALDAKLDDGIPSTGTIRSERNAMDPNCNTTDDPSTAQYNVGSADANACALVFFLGF